MSSGMHIMDCGRCVFGKKLPAQRKLKKGNTTILVNSTNSYECQSQLRAIEIEGTSIKCSGFKQKSS